MSEEDLTFSIDFKPKLNAEQRQKLQDKKNRQPQSLDKNPWTGVIKNPSDVLTNVLKETNLERALKEILSDIGILGNLDWEILESELPESEGPEMEISLKGTIKANRETRKAMDKVLDKYFPEIDNGIKGM